MQTKKYIGLNIIRFMCFYLVFLLHCNWLSGNPTIDNILLKAYPRFYLAVPYFFTLSAFLLSKLALVDLQDQRFSFKQFFVRRALRIYPLYYIFLIFSYALLPIALKLLGLQRFENMPSIWPYLTYTNNIFWQESPFMLEFLWSVAVEEQFYLVFGISVFLLQKRLIVLPITLMIIAYLSKLYFPVAHYANLLIYLPYFSIGIFGAILFHRYEHRLQALFNNTKGKLISFFLILACLYISFYATFLYVPFYNTYVEPIAIGSLFTACLMVSSSIQYKLNIWNKVFNYLGERTYGMYVWHGFILTIAYTIGMKLVEQNKAFNKHHYLLITIVIIMAIVSFQLLEKPFLNLKKYFRHKND